MIKNINIWTKFVLETGTDKSSAFHNYTRIYSKYLSKFKAAPIKFLEIGIYYGNSVKLWERYFPNADLHFIDIDPNQIHYHSIRSHYHFVDQANKKALSNFVIGEGGDFDVIIDASVIGWIKLSSVFNHYSHS